MSSTRSGSKSPIIITADHSTSTQPAEDVNSAKRRTRNACDACRARRVKCHYDGPTCRACVISEIPCTQNKPRKKRGPINRYVEAQRQKEQEEIPVSAAGHATSPVRDTLSPSSSLHLRTAIPVSESTGIYGLDRLAPPSVIQQVVSDWFDLVHPVAPILHRDTFLRQLNDPSISSDPTFINLVFSLCSATVATLRRRSSSSGYGNLISVEHCYDLARRNELAQGVLQDPLAHPSLEWCLTKYNFAVSLGSANGMDHPTSHFLLAQAVVGIGHIIHYQSSNLPMLPRELAKRLYWLCFAAQCTQGLHGRPYLSMLDPETTIGLERPLELKDADLAPMTPGQENWHGNRTSYVPGLNALINLFMLWYKSQQGGLEKVRDLSHLQAFMDQALVSLDNIPPELRWRGGLSRPMRSNFGTDVQMVNLYITQIHIRAFLLDQMDRAAAEIGDTATQTMVFDARQSLVDDMLAIVYQMPEDTLEANGYSLVPKMRDIGLTLLSERSGASVKSLVNLDRLLSKLERLDMPLSEGGAFDATSPSRSLANLSNMT